MASNELEEKVKVAIVRALRIGVGWLNGLLSMGGLIIMLYLAFLLGVITGILMVYTSAI